MNTKPDYGNWIRQKRVYTFIGIGLVLVLLAIIPVHPIIRLVLLLAGVMFLGLGSYLAYISRQFSERGGGYQRKLWNIVLDHLDWDGEGEAMDIGTGNGPLAIALAKRFPGARVTGIDYWGSDWEYSQNTCEQNAALEGVAERTEFRQGCLSTLDSSTRWSAISSFTKSPTRLTNGTSSRKRCGCCALAEASLFRTCFWTTNCTAR